MPDYLRHPLLHEPIIIPRVVLWVLGIVFAAIGVETFDQLEQLAPFTAADILVVLVPAALAHIAQGFKDRAQTNSPATVEQFNRETTALVSGIDPGYAGTGVAVHEDDTEGR